MTFTPYLHFQGNCAEAMQFYAEVFGADDLALQHFSEAPAEMGFDPGSDRVLHGQLSVNGRMLFASDYPDGVEGEPQNAVSISIDAASFAEGQAIYDRLKEGGDAIMPFAETFFAPGFGMLRDRYGTQWMISAAK